MHTKESLKADLAALGIRPNDTVFIHSSMKAIGAVEGGADTVLHALTEYLADGLLVFPTHTWRQVCDGQRVFDAANEPSCVGLLSNMAMRLPGAVRSLHPDHSAVAIGRGAADYVRGDAEATTPCPREGTMGALIDRKGIILLLGCSLKCNTFLHCVEELCGVPDRIDPETTEMTVIAPDGARKTVDLHRHHSTHGGVSEGYDRVAPLLTERGAMWRGTFGDAVVYAERADLVYELVAGVLADDPDYFVRDLHGSDAN